MDPGLALGLALALVAAFLFNLSYMLQHEALDGGPDVDLMHPLRTVTGLFSDRAWLLGTLTGAGGLAIYTAALALAPLSLVQAFLASGLAFAVPMSVRIAGHVLTRRDTVGAILMTTSLVMLAVGTGEHTSTNSFKSTDLAICTAVTVLPAIGLAIAIRGERRAEALALAGGLFFGISDVLINALVGILKTGFVNLVESPWLIVCIATNLAAFFTWQQSLQIGKAKILAIVVLMTAATNVLAIGAGFVVYGDSLGVSTAWKTVHVICFAAIGVAVWLLAPAQAAITALEVADGEAEVA
jgi:drug/metabolite transporter (DMT)-like permease